MVVSYHPRSKHSCCHHHLWILQRDTSIALVGCSASLCHCSLLHPPNWDYLCHHKPGKKKPTSVFIFKWSNGILTLNLALLQSSQAPGLNIITEYIIGYIFPERPVANMCFKVYGYISMTQALTFVQDFKLGHYMKIPPRSMFMAQVRCFIFSLNLNLPKNNVQKLSMWASSRLWEQLYLWLYTY